MYVLGLHLGHDSSAALIKNGKVIGAVQEERFNRIKNFSGYPESSIKYVLSLAKIMNKDVDTIIVPGLKIGLEIPYEILRQRFGYKKSNFLYKVKAWFASAFSSDYLRKSLYNNLKSQSLIKEELVNRGFTSANIEFVDHHTCHAASAYFSSPFSRAIIITQDGKGDGCSGSVFFGKNNSIEEYSRQKDIDSIGQIYAELTRYLGYRPNRHEGKITGLAAFGDSSIFLKDFQTLVDNIGTSINRCNVLTGIKEWDHGLSSIDKAKILSNHPDIIPYEINSLKLQAWFESLADNSKSKDLSAAVQEAVEIWMTELCTFVKDKLSSEKDINFCLAGGLFANVKINQRIKENVPGLTNIYVQPAMGDCGLALGGAQYYWYKNANQISKHEYLSNAYLGPEYSNDLIYKSLMIWEDKIEWKQYTNVEDEIGRLLHEGRIIGRFNGRLEWGPRALGNRSILINPRDKKVNDTVNERLNRTEFMPFAPSVLDYRAKDYFIGYEDTDVAADFMTITYDVYPNVINDIQAVVHIDNTARPQVVRSAENGSYYKILQAYERYSNIGCIVNTSFNLHEEPIVNDPEDALRALEQGAVDILAIGDYLVTYIK
jgi:carbamoyltransferase